MCNAVLSKIYFILFFGLNYVTESPAQPGGCLGELLGSVLPQISVASVCPFLHWPGIFLF